MTKINKLALIAAGIVLAVLMFLTAETEVVGQDGVARTVAEVGE